MKILYGLPSEGMGHTTRSDVIIDYLLQQQHDVEVITSDRAFDFLNKKYPGRVHAIEGFHLAFQGSDVSIPKTILQLIRTAPAKLKANWKQYFHFLRNKSFDCVISDFETYAALYAKLHQVPLLSIDNIQVIDRCKPEIVIPLHERKNFKLAKQVVKMKVPVAQHYLITSFFHIEPRKKNTTLVPSIIRNTVLNLKPSVQQHVLIYQYATSEEDLLATLQQLPNEQFYVFGFNKDEQHGHVHFKSFSEEEFLTLFASAKAVLCHGGFSFISEAVYLKKPIYSVPIANQFEQFFNAAYVQKMGYGLHATHFDAMAIHSFLAHLNTYESALTNYTQSGNTSLFQTLDTLLKGIKC